MIRVTHTYEHYKPHVKMAWTQRIVIINNFTPSATHILWETNTRIQNYNKKEKVYFILRTGHEGPEGEQRYSSTLSLTSALEAGVDGQCHTLASLAPGKDLSTHSAGGWMGSTISLVRCGKSGCPLVWQLDHPACSKSLYRPRYPRPLTKL